MVCYTLDGILGASQGRVDISVKRRRLAKGAGHFDEWVYGKLKTWPDDTRSLRFLTRVVRCNRVQPGHR